MLSHLNVPNGIYVVKYKFPVVEGHTPSTILYPYNQLQLGMIKVTASRLGSQWQRPGSHESPMGTAQRLECPSVPSIAVILEWQPASGVPRTVNTGNVTLVASSNRTTFPPLRSSSVTYADETASILYVVPYVDETWRLKIANTLPPSYEA